MRSTISLRIRQSGRRVSRAFGRSSLPSTKPRSAWSAASPGLGSASTVCPFTDAILGLLRLPDSLVSVHPVGGADPLIPPNSLHSAGSLGSADYVAAGEEFFRYFVDLCELKPDDRVLDVGSGTGRIGRCGNELLLDFRSGLSLPFSLIIEYTRTQPHHGCDPTPRMYAKCAR